MILKEFKELQKQNSKMVVVFSADWCGPCRVFAPIFEDTSEKFPALKFLKLNVDNCGEICAQYEVQSIPTMILFKGTEIVKERVGGFANQAQFIQWIES